ncbi:MAG: hypothetical protein OEZ31_08685 [Nitrospirota bacterium]|nr:hypothetical protein [Nitrospirota bacterium]
MGITLDDPRQKLKSQIFWVGDFRNNKDLSNWYSYVCRTPQLFGHIILANKQRYREEAPKGFEEALNLNINFLLKWSKKCKAKDCYPVFFRMNIKKEQFRVHIIPVSTKEIQEASESLWKRIPELKKEGEGGFIHYLGQREDIADRCQVEFNKYVGDKKAIEALMHKYSIIKVVKQLRDIVYAEGYKCEL